MNEYYSGYTEDEHEEFLNSVYKDVKIGPLEFKPGRVLKTMDYTAFMMSLYALEKGVWKCGRCDREYEFKSDARDCCSWKTKPILGGL